MSTIFVGVGQCGNQLSNKLLDYLTTNQTIQTSYLFNHFDGKFHFVNLDSEPKVINNLSSDHKEHLRLENLINTKCGRGSNWASGYAGLRKDGELKIIEKTLEAIRRESERCDVLLNFNIMHSLSGGTGSGCGSRLIEQLRDNYGPKKYIFTQSVAPFRDGELPLQHYNNLLCLSHLQEHADCIGLYQNDDIFNLIEKQANEVSRSTPSSTKSALLPFNNPKLNKKSASLESSLPNSISINDMNSYIVKCLLSSIYPVDSVSLKTQSFGLELFEMQRFLCSNPNLKIIEVYNVNSSSSGLKSTSLSDRSSNQLTKSNPLVKQLISVVPKYKRDTTQLYTSLNSLLIARGNQDLNEYDNKMVVSQIWQDFDLIKKSLNPVEWNPFTIDLWSSKYAINEPESTTNTNNAAKTKTNSLTLAVNRNKCVDYLSDVLSISKKKFVARAYLHWYEKFNVGDDHFEKAFENLGQIIDSYTQMTH
jgi:hypothetical protein